MGKTEGKTWENFTQFFPRNMENGKNVGNVWEKLGNLPVIPMVEAINKMFEFYRAKNLDMFKDAISLPGLAYKMLMNCLFII